MLEDDFPLLFLFFKFIEELIIVTTTFEFISKLSNWQEVEVEEVEVEEEVEEEEEVEVEVNGRTALNVVTWM